MKNTSKEDNEIKAVIPIAVGVLLPFLVPMIVRVLADKTDSIHHITSDWLKFFVMLFVIMLVCIFPFILQTVLLFLFRKRSKRTFNCLLICGLIGVLSLMIPLHYTYWGETYGNGRPSSTSGIVFIVAPIYCTISGIIGFLFGLLLSRITWFQNEVQNAQ